MSNEFKERDVAILVGASRGIGAKTAFRIAALKKYNLLLLARSKEDLEEVAKECVKIGGIEVRIAVVDVINEALLEATLLSNIDEMLPSQRDRKGKNEGGCFVRVMIFCTGILNLSHSMVSDVAKVDWDRTIRVNLLAAMTTTRVILPYMVHSKCGFIVFISSIVHYATGIPGLASYYASKDGMIGFAKVLLSEVRQYNIKVSSICPGLVNTDMGQDIIRSVNSDLVTITADQLIQAEDVAEAVMYVLRSSKTCCPSEITIEHFAQISTVLDAFLHKPKLSDLNTLYPIREDSGKVALITGASKGIGRMIAIRLASMGFNVGLVARSIQKLQETAEYITSTYRTIKVQTYAIDLSDPENGEAVVHQCVRDFGNLHSLVLNAADNRRKSALVAKKKVWDNVLNLNFLSVVNSCRSALPYMQLSMGIDSNEDSRRSKSIVPPSVIFISSLAIKDQGIAGLAPYYAAKRGLSGFAGCVFADIRHLNIKVSVIAPGLTNTDLGNKKGPVKYMDSEFMIQDSDIADSVEYVVNSPFHICPTQIIIEPQNNIIPQLDMINHLVIKRSKL